MKSRTMHSLMKRVRQHLAIVLLLLMSIGPGVGTATAQAQIRAYVAHAGDSFTASGTVSVIDTATNTVVATIPVGPIPFAPMGIAITPDGTRVYVTNAGDPFGVASGTVAVINTATNTVVATIPVGILPEALAITPDGSRVYATNAGNGFNNIPQGASVIDTATNTVVTNIPIPVTGLPIAIAITPAPRAPTSKEQCKHGGYRSFGPPAGPFKNQGQCVSYVEHH